MAETQFGTNDPRTQKKWSKEVFKYTLKDFFFLKNGWLGTGPNAVIRILKDLEGVNNPGDKITIEMEVPLTSEGQPIDGTVTGYEEALAILNQTVTLNGRAHGVVSKGPLSEKRTAGSFRERAKRQLGIWWRNIALEPDLWRALYGLYNASGIETVNEYEPSSQRIIYGGQTLAGVPSTSKASDALLSAETVTNYLCGLQFLSMMRRLAESVEPKIPKIEVPGIAHPCYLIVLHPLQMKSIRQSTGEHSFVAMMKDAEKRGKDNPIFAGAEFYYDNMIVYSYDRAPMRTGADGVTPAEGFTLNAGRTETTDPVANGKSVARGLLLGANAGVVGFAKGMTPTWHEDMIDARKPQIIVDGMYFTSKTRFNAYTQPSGPNSAQEDFGVYAFDTMVQTDA